MKEAVLTSICKTCNKETDASELVEGICILCSPEEEIKDENNLALSDYRNLYTFSGRSDGLNLVVYGIFVPLALVALGFFIGTGYAVIIGIALALIVGFAAVVRRGRDAGKTPTHTISTLIITSLLMSTLMEKTPFGLMVIGASGNLYVGMIMLAMIENFYFVYLIFAEKSEMKVYKTSKFVKITLALLIGLILLGVAMSLFKQYVG